MKVLTPRRVTLAAGGTGGHLFPAEALARELLSRGIEVLMVTDQRGGSFGDRLPDVQTLRIAAAGIAGGGVLHKLRGALQLAIGYLQARRILKSCKSDAVVGFGGYPSVPTVLAAAHLGLPVVLHEQNAVLGRANRLLAGRAEAIATSFEDVKAIPARDQDKVVRTGNPVRTAIAETGKDEYLPPEESGPINLLVIGGSQGAKAFNELVPAAAVLLGEELRARLNVTQQVPGGEIDAVAGRYDACGVKHSLAAFFDDMPKRLQEAHLVICRSGASTVCELAAAGRPALLVPYPYATDDHQTANAEALTGTGGGWLMPQNTLTPQSLAQRLSDVLSAPALLARASQGARACAELDAAARLADVVCGTFEGTAGRNLNREDGEVRDKRHGTDNRKSNREATA